MSAKQVTSEVRLCDECEAGAYGWEACIRCGHDLCSEHTEAMQFSVHVTGWADAHYCKACYELLLASRSDPEFNAYLAVRELRIEGERFEASFGPRAKAAQAECERLAEARKGRRARYVVLP